MRYPSRTWLTRYHQRWLIGDYDREREMGEGGPTVVHIPHTQPSPPHATGRSGNLSHLPYYGVHTYIVMKREGIPELEKLQIGQDDWQHP